MGMNWRQLVLVVLVAAIVGGASGFVGDQVSAKWTSVTREATRTVPSYDTGNRISDEIYESEQRMKEWAHCVESHREAGTIGRPEWMC